MLEIKTDLKGLSSRAELWAAVIVAVAALAFTAVIVPHRALFSQLEFWLLLGVPWSASGLLCLILIRLYLPRQQMPDLKDAAEANANTLRALREVSLPSDAKLTVLTEAISSSTKATQELASLLRKARQEQK